MKTSWAALLFSVSIHAFCGYAFWESSVSGPVSSPDPIQISLVTERPVIKTKEPELPRVKFEIPKSIPQSIPVKKEKAKTISLAEAQKAQVRSAELRRISEASAEAAPVLQRPKTAIDFMGDAQKEKVFLDYFGKLKEKIQLNLRRRYRGADDSLGVVTLFFVLNPDGSLVKAGVLQKESDAGENLRGIALEALRRSAPFGSFPKDLGQGAVAFNLKVYFDEL